MKAFLPILAALLLIGVSTVMQGAWSDRWRDYAEEDLKVQSANYEHIPLEFGDWLGREGEMDERQLRLAGAWASISRTYTNQLTGERVMVFMILGKSRDVSIHTPDACYVGSGFSMSHEPRNHSLAVGGGTGDFYTSTFSKQHGDRLINQRIFWAWSTDGEWEAPSSPRLKYGANRAVNKVYLISDMPTADIQPPDESPVVQFADEFLPVASKAIFRKTAPAEAPPAT